MKYSQSLVKTLRETPREAEGISSSLLIRGSYIDQETSGIYTLLPLGWRVSQKIVNIVREQMNNLGGQEIFMPTLQPKELWLKTDRWDKMDPPLFKLKDRHEKEFALGSTHEEIIVDIVRDKISSYKELPQMLYQIQTKFRNEQRSSGGLLRTREFIMKDAYSFHESIEDFEKYYNKVIEAYRKIFKFVGIEIRLVEAHSGSIGGEKSNEFMLLAETGEDKIYLCGACDWAVNVEIVRDIKKCPGCGGEISPANAIEVGHIFQLGDLYSKKMNAFFTDKEGQQKPFIMGCYGIGIGRLMAAIVEVSHDNAGIIWPQSVSPYDVYLVELVKGKGLEVYDKLTKSGFEVLYDDRDVSAGVKFADADLLGIPLRLTVSDKTLNEDGVEIKERSQKETKIIKFDQIVDKVKELTTGN